MADENLLRMDNITKEYSGNKALDKVNLNIKRNTIHSIVGENGAGKSTLMKIISGVIPYGKYSGDAYYEDEKSEFMNVNDSEEKGIVIIHQELELVPQMSIVDNLFLGNEITNRGVIDRGRSIQEAKRLLKIVDLEENPQKLVGSLSVGKQQLVEIAKALSKEVKLLILDEPTASLNEDDSENLLKLLLELKKEGITSIMISHKLNEVLEVSDSITVLRDGETVETINNNDITEDRLIKSMVGRELENRYPDHIPNSGDILMEVKNWNIVDTVTEKNTIRDASFNLNRGEIIGIAGLMGAGRTELAKSIFGESYGRKESGDLILNGEKLTLKTPRAAIKKGIAYVTEDRKDEGLVLIKSVKDNMTLANLGEVSNNSVIDNNKEVNVTNQYIDDLNISTYGPLQTIVNLSGGNQQKVVLGKWILTDPEILILDEPTRGIDVGAKYEIYKIINQLADQNKGIIVISSELPELLGITDRIFTMNEGTITGEFKTDDVDQEKLMEYMTKE